MRCEGEIPAQRHMWKERVVLENVAAGAMLGAQVYVGLRVEENAVVEKNAAGVRRDEAGDGIKREGFAGTAGAIENGDAWGGFEFGVEMKPRRFFAWGEAFGDGGVKHGDGGEPEAPINRRKRLF